MPCGLKKAYLLLLLFIIKSNKTAKDRRSTAVPHNHSYFRKVETSEAVTVTDY